MNVICRKANVEDIDVLYHLIQDYADKGIMLPRAKEILKYMLVDFMVAEVDGKVVGCGSLCKLGDDLVEIRSLGLSDGYKGAGIGRKMVEFLVQEAKEMKMPKIMALTYEVRFFERNGFKVVPKEIFPEKVWKDCVYCKKQDCCDEIAVLKRID